MQLTRNHTIHRLKQGIQRHAVALLCAALVGLASIAPSLFAIRDLGADDRGMPFFYLDDEEIYLARMQEILDGHPQLGSAFLYEYKSTPAVLPPLGEYLYALPSLIFHVSLASTLVATKFFFPFILFLLAYALVMQLTDEEEQGKHRRLTAIAAAMLVSLGYDLVSVSDILGWLRGNGLALHLSLWTRPVNPITGGLMLFAYLNLIWNMRRHQRRWLTIPTGILLGVMIGYFFSWGIALSITGLLVVASLVQKKWKQLQQLGLTLGIGLLVGSPVLYNMVTQVGGVAGKQLSLRNGMFFTHAPLMNKTLLIALGIFFALSFYAASTLPRLRQLAKKDWWQWCVLLLLAGLAALNQQVLTGREIWPYHFVQYTKPLMVIALVVSGWFMIQPKCPRIWKTSMLALITFVLLEGGASAASYSSMVGDFAQRQSYVETFNYLNSQQPVDCVVLVKEETEWLSRQIPAFTHCNDYISTWVFSGIPAERIRFNYFVSLRLRGITADQATSDMRAHWSDIRGFFFEDWSQLFAKGDDAWVETKIADLVPRYQEFLNHSFAEELKSYRIDVLAAYDKLSTAEQVELGIHSELGKIGPVYLYAF